MKNSRAFLSTSAELWSTNGIRLLMLITPTDAGVLPISSDEL